MKSKPTIPFFRSETGAPKRALPEPSPEAGIQMEEQWHGDKYEFALDLNSYVIHHPEATFFVRVEGDSMEGAGIFSGDLLVVDRSIEPSDGRVVLAVVDGDFTVRILKRENGRAVLMSDPGRGWSGKNSYHPPVEITGNVSESGGASFVWGVVVGALHKF